MFCQLLDVQKIIAIAAIDGVPLGILMYEKQAFLS